MGESNASVVVGTVLTLGFFFDGALVTESIGCSIMLGGIGAVTDVGMYWGDLSDSVLLAGEAVAVAFIVAVVDLSSAFLGDFLFFSDHFGPAFLRFFRLDLTRLLGCCTASFAADGSCADCCCCSSCGSRGSRSIWRVLLGAKF